MSKHALEVIRSLKFKLYFQFIKGLKNLVCAFQVFSLVCRLTSQVVYIFGKLESHTGKWAIWAWIRNYNRMTSL